MSENPFIFNNPVKGEGFYDREEEIDLAIGFIKTLQSFSVIGERRIGKTSFLLYILSEDTMKKYGIDPEKYIIVHIDMASERNMTKENLIDSIVKKIKGRLHLEIESENVFEEFEIYVDELASKGKNLIIALDEFELTPILDYHFSYWLRSILQRQHVLAITASRITMREITLDGKASPLFNVFGNIFLGLFAEEKTNSMIRKMFEKEKILLREEEISFLTKLSGRNPYLIQFFGYYYYEERKRKEKVACDEFKNKMSHYLKDQFENYLEHLTDKEKDFLFYPKKLDHPVGRMLERKRFLIEEDGKWKIFSELFEDFLQEKKESRFQKFLKYEKKFLKLIKRILRFIKRRIKNLSLLEIVGWTLIVIIMIYILLKFLGIFGKPNIQFLEGFFQQVTFTSLAIVLSFHNARKSTIDTNKEIGKTTLLLQETIKKLDNVANKIQERVERKLK
jgi:hypothetical protein